MSDYKELIVRLRFDNPLGIIPTIPQTMNEAADALERLTAERDELLATLNEAREVLQLANDTPNGPICDTVWMIHKPETLFDFMDDAIARVKGK